MKLTNEEIMHSMRLVQKNLHAPDAERGISAIIDYFTFLSWDLRREDYKRFHEL